MDYNIRLSALKKTIFDGNNNACFIEREHFLNGILAETPAAKRNSPEIFRDLLKYVSTPMDENDVFAGRAVEALPDFAGKYPNALISSLGHLTPDYNSLITLGYKGILEKIKQNAAKIGTDEAKGYAESCEIVVNAIREFALRYAESARKCGNVQAYNALLKVPYEPAYDLYSALQGIWLVHFIASCYVGARDYGFGYMDEYLYPFYLKEIEKGTEKSKIVEMLAGFFIKTNEICGRNSHNYNPKPVPCQSAKQYVLLDGGKANELSALMLDAVILNNMPQPETTVVLSQKASDEFENKVFEALEVLTDKVNVYNFELLQNHLKQRGLPQEIYDRPSFSACCTFDLSFYSVREEFFCPTVKIFTDLIYNNEFSSKQQLLEAFSNEITKACTEEFRNQRENKGYWQDKSAFFMDSMLIGGCNDSCDFAPTGARYRTKNVFLMGIATLGDSLCTLDKTVFSGKMAYNDFINMLKADFNGYETEHGEILKITKFGNDSQNDLYVKEIAETLVTAVERTEHTENEVVISGFYSLTNENDSSADIPATPDGRKSRAPFSENQSPTYGTDKMGVTALLNSLSQLPFNRAISGGMNLTFSKNPKRNILRALVTAYFKKGGLHIGITVLSREELEDAIKSPEKYPTLTVRLYGFSEYFINLPPWQQQAVINRTAY